MCPFLRHSGTEVPEIRNLLPSSVAFRSGRLALIKDFTSKTSTLIFWPYEIYHSSRGSKVVLLQFCLVGEADKVYLLIPLFLFTFSISKFRWQLNFFSKSLLNKKKKEIKSWISPLRTLGIETSSIENQDPIIIYFT